MSFDNHGSASTARNPLPPTPDFHPPYKPTQNSSHSSGGDRSRKHRKSLSMTFDSSGRPAPIDPYSSTPDDNKSFDSEQSKSQSRDTSRAAPVAGRRHRKSLSMTMDNRGASPAANDPPFPTPDFNRPISSRIRAPGPTTRRRNLRKSLSLSANSRDNAHASNYPATLTSDGRDNTHTPSYPTTPTSDGRRTPSRVRFNDEVDVLMFADVAAAAAAVAADLATAPRDMTASGSNRYKNKHGHAAAGEYNEIVHGYGSDSEGEERGGMVEEERELVSSVSLPPLSFSLLLALEETSTAVSSPTRFPRSKSQN
ncbi:unnamed protein product [Closterium sp. Naga37s-1]|nr:unnamed protein product [Closterium sp. Naga37s-1]